MSNVQKKYEELYKKSINELEKIEKGKDIHIFVGSATCEIAAGANEVYDELKKHIASSGKKNIQLK